MRPPKRGNGVGNLKLPGRLPNDEPMALVTHGHSFIVGKNLLMMTFDTIADTMRAYLSP